MIANVHTKSQLQQLIPGLSVHAIDEARTHASKLGAGINYDIVNGLKSKSNRLIKELLFIRLIFLNVFLVAILPIKIVV